MEITNSYFTQIGYIRNNSTRAEKAKELEKNINKKVIVRHHLFSIASFPNYIIGEVKFVNFKKNYYQLNIQKDNETRLEQFLLSELEFLAVEE